MKKDIIKILFALMVTVFLARCHDHEDFIAQHHEVNIQFDSTRLRIQESEEQRIINITFDKPAFHTGWLRLLVNSSDLSRFMIEPNIDNGYVNLNVMQGQQSATVTIKPINNNLDEANHAFDISISNVSDGFTMGMKKSVVINLEDDDSLASTPRVVANFKQAAGDISEMGQKSLSIQLSGDLESAGSIELAVHSDEAVYGVHYTTEPVVVDGKINLSPAIGTEEITLVIIPINNEIITGDSEITFSISSTSGAIEMGTTLTHSVLITDDELIDKPKGFETQGGQWSLKKSYEYDEEGRVKFVHIEKSTPSTSSYTETYYYDPSGRIQKINRYPGIDITYTWSNNRIIRSETIDHNVVKEYIEYDYDAQGNVSGTANFFRQPNGEFKLSFMNVYLYFEDNNLYKSQTFIPTDDTEQFTLLSTRTYEGYLTAANPFPMVEIIPGMTTQTNLPSLYIIEENGMTLTYRFSYEFRADNRVSKRITNGASTMEVSNYHYY